MGALRRAGHGGRGIRTGQRPLLEVVRAAGGVPTELFSAIALVTVANGALLTGTMSSRLAYGVARDRLLPNFLTKVLPGMRTPWAAIATTTALSLLLKGS